MIQRFFAGLALALSLLAPAFSANQAFEAGALRVEKLGAADKGARAVILIPGLASGPWVWRDTAPRLARSHAVYLVTLPGFDGRAAQPGVTLQSLQRDLLRLIQQEKLHKPVLVGHSLGGALSLAFATEHSSAIAGVVSVDGLPVFPGTEHAPDRTVVAEATRRQFAAMSPEQFASGQQMYMRTIGSAKESVAVELAPLAARSDVTATADFAAQLMALDLRPRLSAIEVPVVVISPFHEPDFARMGVNEPAKTGYYRGLLSGVAKLDVVSIADARHFVMFDQPEKFAEALDPALAKMFE